MVLKKSDLIILCDRLLLQKIIVGSLEFKLTTILYHHFFFDQEDSQTARDRLKRECEWLRNNYTLVSAKRAFGGLDRGELPRNSLLVTIDDAKVQLLDVIDIFQSFEIPIVLFVCVGWTDRGSPIDKKTALSRIIAELHWYNGPDETFILNGRYICVETGSNDHLIDDLIETAENDSEFDFTELATSIDQAKENKPRQVCNWDEIADLVSAGVEMGSHSVSHAKLGHQTDRRLRYEILQSMDILSSKVGSCPHFAYPYGDAGTFDKRSRALLSEAGHQCGFITKAGFASSESDLFELPRIVMPEAPMKLAEFQARVRGGGIPLTVLKQFLS